MTRPRLILLTALGAGLIVVAATYTQSRPNDRELRQLQYAAAPGPANEPGTDRPSPATSGKTVTRKIKIEVYEGGALTATITIPGWLLTGASKLLPRAAGKKLQDRNVDVDQLIELLKDPQASGIVLDIEDHKGNESLVISIVRDDGGAPRK